MKRSLRYSVPILIVLTLIGCDLFPEMNTITYYRKINALEYEIAKTLIYPTGTEIEVLGDFVYDDPDIRFLGWSETEDGFDISFEGGETIVLDTDIELYIQRAIKTPESDFTYSLNEADEIVITGYVGDAQEIMIPSTIEGFPVRIVGGIGGHGKSGIVSVFIDEGIREIGGVFNQMPNLQFLTLPTSLETVGYGLLAGTSSIKKIRIPDGVETISPGAFSYSGIEEFHVSDANESFKTIDGVLFSKDGKTIVSYPSKRSGDSYRIPNGVEIIGSSAFYDSTQISNLTIPDTVVEIENRGFNGIFVETIELPSNLRVIGKEAFHNAYSLTEITIPSSVTTMGEKVFYLAHRLTDIYCEAPSKPEGWSDQWSIKHYEHFTKPTTIHWNSTATKEGP